MCSIFIDTNILLGFWSLKDGRVPSDLIAPLLELKDHILITEQIAQEIQRNKLSVFLKNCAAFSMKLPAQYPDHMENKKEVEALNNSFKKLNSEIKKNKKKWDLVKSIIANEIVLGEDSTSKMLEPLLSKMQCPNDNQMSRARDRRERGNPPGKRTDPLGDQISWEQFLDAITDKESIFIITRDSDFTESIDKNLVLNPLLHSDLQKRGAKNIYVYDNLSTALKAIKASNLIKLDIEDQALEKLEIEEEAHNPTPPYITWHDGAWKCPNCNNINANAGLSAHPSQYGGWSYWASCTKCGFRFDTGEAYDD